MKLYQKKDDSEDEVLDHNVAAAKKRPLKIRSPAFLPIFDDKPPSAINPRLPPGGGAGPTYAKTS